MTSFGPRKRAPRYLDFTELLSIALGSLVVGLVLFGAYYLRDAIAALGGAL